MRRFECEFSNEINEMNIEETDCIFLGLIRKKEQEVIKSRRETHKFLTLNIYAYVNVRIRKKFDFFFRPCRSSVT